VLAGEVFHDIQRDPKADHDPVAMLTARQREILQLFAEGRSAKEMASALDISVRTVEFHKYQMMQFLHVHNGVELIHFAIKSGIVAI
jgi:DNA-binding NarL/FixJ family response regulator